MSEPIYKRHLDYAIEHKDECEASKHFHNLAAMYMSHADEPTYALLQGAAEDLEKIMDKPKPDGHQLIQDHDCHWYIIPLNDLDRFNQFIDDEALFYSNYNEWTDNFESKRINGPHRIIITEWREG